MHLETLLYMLLQSDKSIPPPGNRPDFEALAVRARKDAVPNQWVRVPASEITVGMSDPENNKEPDRYFGWDNEKPERCVHVQGFEAKARPITNEDYGKFLEQTHRDKIPASWACDQDSSSLCKIDADVQANGNQADLNKLSPPLTKAYLNGKSVRTVYGSVPLKYALDWPVFASYDELAPCAAWMGGRIPSAEEVGAIYSYVDSKKSREVDNILARKISAVNGYAAFLSLFSTFTNVLTSQQASLQRRRRDLAPVSSYA